MRQSSTRIVIVGAGGWLGLATLEALRLLLGDDSIDRIICFGSQRRTLELRDGVRFEQQALADLSALRPATSIVLHLAYLTQDKAGGMSEAAYTDGNREISERLHRSLDRIGAEAIFLPSSGATYLIDDPRVSDSMRLYGRLKLEDEERFGEWAIRAGRRAAIARVFNLSGPYINKQDTYALACFIADALADRPLKIRATRPVWRSYVAISELMSVVFGLLTEAGSGVTRFDTAGDTAYEMADLASVVSSTLGHKRGSERPEMRDLDPDRYLGEGTSYRHHRQRLDVFTLDMAAQIQDTVRFMVDEASERSLSCGTIKL